MAEWQAYRQTSGVFPGAESVSDEYAHFILPLPYTYFLFPLLITNRKNRYAYKYQCPQIFCFDHKYLLMIQFRANDVSKIKDANCGVDCWIVPRRNEGGTPLRYALYRLILQGLRRCQSLRPIAHMSLRGVRPHHREFFNGQPVWKMANGKYSAYPMGCYRKVDASYGAFYWVDEHGNDEKDEEGHRVWDTEAFWGETQATGQQHDVYQQGSAFQDPETGGYGEDFYGNV